jgi:hypothetical protein
MAWVKGPPSLKTTVHATASTLVLESERHDTVWWRMSRQGRGRVTCEHPQTQADRRASRTARPAPSIGSRRRCSPIGGAADSPGLPNEAPRQSMIREEGARPGEGKPHCLARDVDWSGGPVPSV